MRKDWKKILKKIKKIEKKSYKPKKKVWQKVFCKKLLHPNIKEKK